MCSGEHLYEPHGSLSPTTPAEVPNLRVVAGGRLLLYLKGSGDDPQADPLRGHHSQGCVTVPPETSAAPTDSPVVPAPTPPANDLCRSATSWWTSALSLVRASTTPWLPRIDAGARTASRE